MDSMLVHRKVTPSSKFAGTQLYTWVKRGTASVKCLAYKNTTQCPGRGSNPEWYLQSFKQLNPYKFDATIYVRVVITWPWFPCAFVKFKSLFIFAKYSFDLIGLPVLQFSQSNHMSPQPFASRRAQVQHAKKASVSEDEDRRKIVLSRSLELKVLNS